MKEKSIRGKVVIANVILLVMLVAIVGLLRQERSVTRSIEAESDSIRIVHNEISAVHRRITELAMQGETAVAWTEADKQRYDSLLQETDSMLEDIKESCKGYVQPTLIDSVSTLLYIKGQHLADLMEMSVRHKTRGRELLNELPKATKKATEVKVEKRKKSGLAGLLGGKKKVTVVPSDADRNKLKELHGEIVNRHEQRIKDMAIYTDSLRRSNRILNTQINDLITELDAQTQKAISNKESQISEARARTLYILAGVAVIALIAIALLTLNIRRELRRRRKYKEEREKLIAELKQSNDEKDELIKTRRLIIQTVTHELRTPLTVVIGNAGMIEDGEDEGTAISHARNISMEGKRMSAMVDSLLIYFRLDSDKDSIELKPFDITSIGETLETEYNKLATDKRLEFDVVNNAEGIVYGDAAKMTMIGSNLLANAIKFTKNGTVRLRMDYADEVFTIVVEDTGTGIPKDKQEMVFMPFERLSNAATKDGFGLGLSIVKNLTEIMDGTITLDSDNGKGCKFTIRIPLKLATESIEECSEIKKVESVSPCNIIVIDDSDLVLTTIKDMLTKAGMYCDTCYNADELMARMRNRYYNIVMTDLKMEGMDGYDILELLRMSDIGNSKTIPVIVVTASGYITEEELCEAGFDGVLFKPFSKSALLSVVSKHALRTNDSVEPDLSKLLSFGDEESILTQLIEETTLHMNCLQMAIEGKNIEQVRNIVHHLRSSWMLIKVDMPLKRLSNVVKDCEEWNEDVDKNAGEVLTTGEKVIAAANKARKEAMV